MTPIMSGLLVSFFFFIGKQKQTICWGKGLDGWWCEGMGCGMAAWSSTVPFVFEI